MADQNEEVNRTIDEFIEKLRRFDPKLAEAAVKQISNLGKEATATAKTFETAKKQIDNTSASLSKLDDEYKSGKKSYAKTVDDLNSINRSIEHFNETIEDSDKKAAALAKLQEKRDKLGAELGSKVKMQAIGTAVASAATSYVEFYMSQLKKGITALQGDGSAVQVASELYSSQIDSAAQASGKVAGIMTGAGAALAAIPTPATMAAGALVSLAGSALDASTKMASEVAKFALDVVTKELEKTTKSFAQATTAGALFADGLTGLRTAARDAGMDQVQFSKVISENSESLANFGGTVTDGAKRLGAVSKAAEGQRKSLLNLGISIEDQIQGQADYMSLLQVTGQLRGKTDAQLAAESAGYLTNLKAISAITGEDAKAAAKRARDASMQSAVRSKLEAMGGEASVKFANSIKLLPADMQKAAQQMLVSGTITDSSLAASLADMPGAMDLLKRSVADVTDANINATQATSNYQSNLKDLGPQIRQDAKSMMDTVGLAQLHGVTGIASDMANFAGSMMTLGQKAAGLTGEAATAQAEAAKNTQDDLTNKVSESTTALQNMRVELQDRLTPAIKMFADMMPSILKSLDSRINTVLGELNKNKNIDKTYSTDPILNPEMAYQFGGMMAEGGITETGKWHIAGEAGTEAVIPLPDGRTVPVQLDATTLLGRFKDMVAQSDVTSSEQSQQVTSASAVVGTDLVTAITALLTTARDQLDKQDEMLRVMADNRDNTERLYHAMS